MAHLHRFYISPEDCTGPEIMLAGDEAHHATRVARVRADDSIALFDGRGREIVGVVKETDRHTVRVRVEDERCEPPPVVRLTLLQAWLNRDKPVEAIVEHGTELGVDRFVFFRAARSERPVSTSDRWRRIAVEACKQTGRLWLPEFDTAATLAHALAQPFDSLLFATLDVRPVPIQQAIRRPDIAVLIGPEGDFCPDEITLILGHNATPISLGPYVYRAEMAAQIAATLIQHELSKER